MNLKRKYSAFSLTETLLTLCFIPSILLLSNSVLKSLSHVEIKTVDQYDIFLRQFQQLLQRSEIKNCDDAFRFNYNKQKFTLTRDGARLVKEPGYEILLFDMGFFDPYAYNLKTCNVHFSYGTRLDEFDVYWYPDAKALSDEIGGPKITTGADSETPLLPGS